MSRGPERRRLDAPVKRCGCCSNQLRLRQQRAHLVSEQPVSDEPPAQLALLNDDGTLMCLCGEIIDPVNLIRADLLRSGRVEERRRVRQPAAPAAAVAHDAPLSFQLMTKGQCVPCSPLESFYGSKLGKQQARGV